jgi:hypothetical protein
MNIQVLDSRTFFGSKNSDFERNLTLTPKHGAMGIEAGASLGAGSCVLVPPPTTIK